MQLLVKTNNEAIILPTELDRTGVGELRAAFESARSGSSIELDGAKIRRIHTPGVQLLCALVLAAEGRGARITWTAVPPTLVTYINLLGIGDVIQFHGPVPPALEYFD